MVFIGSPNYTQGRGKKIDRIVVHWIVGKLSAADAVFKNPSTDLSAHYAIGNKITHQYVTEDNTAWHAGVWTMNQRSIGIEHEGGPNLPISDETYKTSAKLIAEIAQRYGIPLDRNHIIGHREVKPTQCPGTLDIDRLISLAKGEDTHADNLTKMLGADYIRDNQKDIFNPKLDIKDTNWSKIVIGKLDELERELQRTRTSLTAAKEDRTEAITQRDRGG